MDGIWLAGRIAVVAVTFVGLTSAATAGNVWHFYSSDEPSAFLGVVDESEVDNAEAYFPFSLLCSAAEDWTMRIGGVDHVKLGGAIAKGDQPVFSVLFDGKQDESLSQYFPDINFAEMTGEWEYAAVWPLALMDKVIAAKQIRIKGVGVDMTLPPNDKSEMGAFKAACEDIESSSAD